MSFNTELFTDQYDDIKQEFVDEDYRSMPFQEELQQYSPAESAQLLELQTPTTTTATTIASRSAS